MPSTRIAVPSIALLLAAGCGGAREAVPAPGVPVTVPGGGGGSGVVVVETCTGCHGDPGRATAGIDPLAPIAPPKAISGNPADPAIGAHQVHLRGGNFSSPVACVSCHIIPSAVTSHPAQAVVFVGMSIRILPGDPRPPYTPTWDGVGCSATYCHGNFQNGKGANPISWNSTGTAFCGSCHGFPPTTPAQGGSHSDRTDCGSCHPTLTNGIPDPATHINGRVDFPPPVP